MGQDVDGRRVSMEGWLPDRRRFSLNRSVPPWLLVLCMTGLIAGLPRPRDTMTRLLLPWTIDSANPIAIARIDAILGEAAFAADA